MQRCGRRGGDGLWKDPGVRGTDVGDAAEETKGQPTAEGFYLRRHHIADERVGYTNIQGERAKDLLKTQSTKVVKTF